MAGVLLPNFVIIGAVKGGTTSLHRYLSGHPDVFMSPVKEPNFFAYEHHPLDFQGPRDQELGAPRFSVTRFEDYCALFAGHAGQKAVGEASPFYLCIDGVAERLTARIPDARLIAVLRDPAERAFSNYLMFVRDRRERLSFRQALAACEARRRANWAQGWQYLEMGFYARQLRRFYAVFPADRIKIILSEDLSARPAEIFREVLAFLGVSEDYTPDFGERLNLSTLKRRRLDRLVNRPNPLRTAARWCVPAGLRRALARFLRARVAYRPTLSARDRAMLIAIYRDDILDLQTLTGFDLHRWLE